MMALLWSSASILAQVPSYVPTNGLVGYWPFNGNANDASGNGNNGTVNGASLSSDRSGITGNAYSFNGTSSSILVANNSSLPSNNFTISLWFQAVYNGNANYGSNLGRYLYAKGPDICPFRGVLNAPSNSPATNISQQVGINGSYATCSNSFNDPTDQWHHLILTYDGISQKQYIDGTLMNTTPQTGTLQSNTGDLSIGCRYRNSGFEDFFLGKLDDIGIWNRALNASEVTNLYRACTDSIITNQPTNVYVGVGLNAQFTTTSKTGSTYQWQTNPLNIGWMNVPANSYYNGVNTNTLGVNNISVSNHNQAFRVLVDAGGCKDTSSMAYIKVADTCLTTVTDTLIIQTTVGLPTPNTTNTLLIYPNPAKDRITIDNGNYTVMAGYSIKIENSLGQQVFSSAITQAQFNIDLSTWTGKGIYFVRVLDAQGNVVTTRKILLQ